MSGRLSRSLGRVLVLLCGVTSLVAFHPARGAATADGGGRANAAGFAVDQAAQTEAAPAGYSVLGIDVSSHDHSRYDIDWRAVAASGAKFAYVKATEGQFYTNPYFHADNRDAKAAGLLVGAYVFGRPDLRDPIGDANYFLDRAEWKYDNQTLIPFLDLEWPYGALNLPTCYGLSPTEMVNWIRAFVEHVRARIGRPMMIYTNTYWWNPCTGNNTSFGENPLDIAGYTTSPPPLPSSWNTFTIWQYKAGNNSNPGDYDRDAFNGDYAALTRLTGPPPEPTGSFGQWNTAINYGRVPHTFDYELGGGGLRHGRWDGKAWRFEILDGPDTTYLGTGATTDNVGTHSTAVEFRGELHVWYYDTTAHSLRHAWQVTGRWYFETLDGAGSVGAGGRTANDVGQYVSAVIYNGLPHIWYHDATTKTLRHAWWMGTRWDFEVLDGSGAPGGGGRTTNDVGQYAVAVLYGSEPHLWYYDATVGRLRHGWWTGERWIFEVLDGSGAPGGGGRTTNDVGQHAAVVLYRNEPHLWYYDATARGVRHGWWTGQRWIFEALDGSGAPGGSGRTVNDVGQHSTVVLYNNEPHVWYYDATAKVQRHGWWAKNYWSFENLSRP